MDPQARILLKLVEWLRRPPSRQMLWIIGAAIAVAVAAVLFERAFGWPEWLTPDRAPRVVR